MRQDLEHLLLMVEREMERGKGLNGKLNSHHEAYGVLCEEVAEYFDEVRRKERDRDSSSMRAELIQIAAVALRAAHELT